MEYSLKSVSRVFRRKSSLGASEAFVFRIFFLMKNVETAHEKSLSLYRRYSDFKDPDLGMLLQK